ncbi:MAG: ImmA/IrrE family metallo-endopeptidase [Micrococcaceae bacterium]
MGYYSRIQKLKEELDVTIFPSEKMPPKRLGSYEVSSHSILWNTHQSDPQKWFTIAHELSHAKHGDTSCHGYLKTKQELRADKEAAQLLITKEEIVEAYTDGMTDIELAHELNVDIDALKIYKSMMSENEFKELQNRVLKKF